MCIRDSLFGPEEKEGLRKLIWKMAQFFGVKVLTYCVMDNHFHILVRVKDRQKFGRKFYGEKGEEHLLNHLKSMYSRAFLDKLKTEIESLRALGLEKDVEALLDQFRNRFCDLSVYMKEVKERFSRKRGQAEISCMLGGAKVTLSILPAVAASS